MIADPGLCDKLGSNETVEADGSIRRQDKVAIAGGQ